MAEMAGRDAMSTTGKNLLMLRQETGLNPWEATPRQFSDKLSSVVTDVPPQDEWRLQYLGKLLVQRYNMGVGAEETKIISNLIDSRCVN